MGVQLASELAERGLPAENDKTSISASAAFQPRGFAPRFMSIADAAIWFGESQWTIKQALRHGELDGRKSGKRTLIVFTSMQARAERLPVAKFAPPVARRQA
jgi:hypothetical protein